MKKLSAIIVLSAFFSLLPGWNEVFAQETPVPVEFLGNVFNPVLTHGIPGSYDGDLLVASFILWGNGNFYLFYSGNGGTCLATSPNGYDYTKFEGNPVLTPSGIGYDSLGAGSPAIIKIGSEWNMYFNARHLPGWGPGESIGRATTDSLKGIWERADEPALVGTPGDWDAGLMTPFSVLPLDTGGYIMFYYASVDFNGIWLIGMATSPDGVSWTKYDDPNTTEVPYAESDPVLPVGEFGEFDEWGVTGAGVFKKGSYYHMYIGGFCLDAGTSGIRTDIGFAYSTDGITWTKWPENPVYVRESDPYFDMNTMIFEQPTVLVYNSTLFMYYDYGTFENSVGLATGDIVDGIIGITKGELRITNYPNPFHSSATLRYTLEEPADVTIHIVNCLGQVVATLTPGIQVQGEQQVTWDAGGLPAGVYTCRINAGRWVANCEMVKL